ncbi:MAG: hypothetical protein MUF00_17350 [Gemmatimonadaceae bacterium]|nr:hypothetical protein [Gemmatimonadaceae bacterium]
MDRPLRLVLSVSLLVTLTACRESSDPIVPVPLPPLTTQTWYVHVSDGQPLPALLGHRQVNGLLEQDFLDSSRLELYADGRWEQRAWYQRFRGATFTEARTAFDAGRWVATTTSYELRAPDGALRYTLGATLGAELTLNLQYAPQSGVAVSTLRRTPAPLTIVGRWRAATLDGRALPAVYTADSSIDAGAGLVSRHILIDSALVTLQANNRYTQEVYYSEWEGPVNGPPQVRVYRENAVDFGTWNRTAFGGLLLESGWLQNKRITGQAREQDALPLRLLHGITHGDPPVEFLYQRR